jgi:5-methylcytosine-specific restriction endonuclease McrA
MAGWSERNGSTSAWRRLRRMVLVRDGRVCQMRQPGCTGVATTVDHVVPLALGGTDHPSNLRAACAACNTRSGAALASHDGRLGSQSRRWT